MFSEVQEYHEKTLAHDNRDAGKSRLLSTMLVTIISVATITGKSSGQTSECLSISVGIFAMLAGLAGYQMAILAVSTVLTAPTITSPFSLTQASPKTITIHSESTVYLSAGGGGRGGLSRADIIALGVGVGVGLPASLAHIVTCLLAFQGCLRMTTM
ncbi:hypothetical protein BDV96DRAFT_179816 [Lophiotrema nucula]|uniref:Uncharacterized protein n=1 Tax=Lophiotrema nucula TaxID=690887 RepID=A0A6A5YXJ6_9PLEO|nr:hypothetical protein BDV96DRAFT_179816 [Lophiotrema nucula]